MTPLSAKLRALHEAATPGEWRFGELGHALWGGPDGELIYDSGARQHIGISDAALIVALRNALPALADLIEAAEAMAAHVPAINEAGPALKHYYATLARLDEVMK